MNKSFYVSTFLFLSAVKILTAQSNLVLNGSFENYTWCPSSTSFPVDYLSYAPGWSSAECSPDYYNVCNNGINGIVGVPNNSWGYQTPFQGNSYGGFGAFACFPLAEAEYMRCELAQPLEPCTEYHVSFYVSLADLSTYAVGKIGAYFSENPIGNGLSSCTPLIFQPQIVNSSGVISDTTGWVKIEGTFIANGCESYMTIGYSVGDITNDTLFIQPNSLTLCPQYSYYYVDSVSVYKTNQVQSGCLCSSEISVPNIFTPNADGQNDLFELHGIENGDHVQIFDRWGVKVFESSQSENTWDGRNTSGAECVDGVYYYIIERKKDETIKGFVQLLR